MHAHKRSVLHVLPHAGGGGDTYVDLLDDMDDYRFERVYITPKRKPGVRQVVMGLADLPRLLRGHDLLHIHGEATAALLLPLLVARPSVVTLHGLHLLRRVTGVRRRAAELNLRALVRTARRTICVSVAERDAVAAVIGGAAARRATVVRNGARLPPPTDTTERARARAEFGIAESDVAGIWVGSLDERRDPLSVVRAAEGTSTPLLVVGDGPLRQRVERAAGAHVRVLGPRHDVPHLLTAADFFVLMSQREGLSFALLEAMAHGLPAIVADVAENVEAIGNTGVVVPYGDEEAVATAFRRFRGSGGERASLGKHARRRVEAIFSAEEMIARTRTIYDEVLAEPRWSRLGRSRSA
jgi:glycosyltransferase involved in cell wall biosynthesis